MSNRMFSSRTIIASSLFVLIILVGASTVIAQDPTVSSRRTPSMSRDMRYREWTLKDMEKRGKKKLPEQQELVWSEINEDYKRIQILNNELLDLSRGREELDFELIGKAAAEIHKRGARLKSNLALPSESANDGAAIAGTNDLQIRTLLSALSGLIVRFVRNPIFDEPDVLDTQAVVRARKDLERVIDLSKEIKLKAQQLKQK